MENASQTTVAIITARCYASAVLDIGAYYSLCPSVRPSVRLSVY